MTTPSSDCTPPAALFSSKRTFRVWRYGIGHSRLLLRAVPDSTESTRLDIFFESVDAMKLVSRYDALEIHSVSESEFSEIYEESGVDPQWRHDRVIVRLQSRSGSGYVQCHKIVAERGGEPVLGPDEPLEPRDLVWVLRPSHSSRRS